MKLAIIGPNLFDQTKGSFHVHSADCRDGKNGRKYPLDMRTEVELSSQFEVSEFIYSDCAGDHDYKPGTPEFKKYIEGCTSDFYFHNCCKALK
jgi:hypothetical protein